eukprot:GHVU01174667.1.p1 GENE.GHVU01174667.1~~GHVU01174667.1.p1  ORF type:complete len:140 (-),score=6.38 GHVU01174667.1:190-576(-)
MDSECPSRKGPSVLTHEKSTTNRWVPRSGGHYRITTELVTSVDGEYQNHVVGGVKCLGKDVFVSLSRRPYAVGLRDINIPVTETFYYKVTDDCSRLEIMGGAVQSPAIKRQALAKSRPFQRFTIITAD